MDFRASGSYRTGSRPFCSTSGSTASPSGPGRSSPSACLDRSPPARRTLLRGALQGKHGQRTNNQHRTCTALPVGECCLAATHLKRAELSALDQESMRKCCITECLCTRCLCWTALDFAALPGFRFDGGVAAVAPGYQLLPLVALHLSNLDAAPAGLAALGVAKTRGLD